MTQTFKILGYHLELFNRLGKYIGHVRMDTPDRNESDFGYGGRRTEYVQAEATKTSKKFNGQARLRMLGLGDKQESNCIRHM